MTADDLDAALALAKGCPHLDAGGGVEVGKLTVLNSGRNAIAPAELARGHGESRRQFAVR